MRPANQMSDNQEDEISLKQLIINLQEWVKYLLGKWLVISIVIIAGGALGIFLASIQQAKYTAELTFVLEDNKSSALGSYAGLASQFGVDLEGSAGSGVFSGDNIIEFLRSRLMVEKTLLSPILIGGKQKTIADFYIDISGKRDELKAEFPTSGEYYPIAADRNKFTLKQDSVLALLVNGILKSNLNITKLDKKVGFLLVKCTSTDQVFSKAFVERLVDEAIGFYVDMKTRRSKGSVDRLQARADSIEQLLNRKTYSAASTMDLNRNPARSLASVSTELVTRDKIILQTMYAEVIKNLEISKMSMAQETPIIQIVDQPRLPLRKEKFGRFKAGIAGAMFAAFLVIAALVVRRGYKHIMANK